MHSILGLKEAFNTKCKKEASNREKPLIKHEIELKIRLFSVRVGAQICEHKELEYRSK